MLKETAVDIMTDIEASAFAEVARHLRGEHTDPDERHYPEAMDPAALHGLVGDLVRTIEPHTEADPVAILIQAIAFFGNAAGRNAYFEVEATRHYPNVFAGLVGVTAKGRKGTSEGRVKAPFRSVDEHWAATCQQSGLSSGEGLIWAVRDLIQKKEPIKDKGRVTDYQTVTIDSGIEDKRLLVIESEFASTLRVMQRDGNTLSAVLRNAWDTGDLRVMTKNSAAVATGAHVSIVGHITADELRRYLDRTEAGNGFANRFLWLCVKRSKCLPEGGNIAAENFSPILFGLRRAIDFARQADRVTFDATAREMWHSVYPELSEGCPGLLGAVTARQEAQAVRLALIYALLDCSPFIREPHLLAALAIVDYVRASAAFVFGDATGDPVSDDILRALRQAPEGMTRTEISGLFGRHKDATALGRALSALQTGGKARREVIPTEGGRPKEVWYAADVPSAPRIDRLPL